MKLKIIFTLLLSATYFFTYAFTDEKVIEAMLKSVIVYRSGAEMHHTASAQIIKGNSELVIDNISNNIDVNSLQVKVPSSVTILAVEFSTNYLISADKTSRQQMLEDSIKSLQENINKLSLSINNTTELLDVLKANREIKGEQAGLSVAELTKLMDYYQTKSLELQNSVAQLLDKRNKLSELVVKVQQQISEEQKKNVSNSGKLTLRLYAAITTKADFEISYIARNAYWTPFYDIRADNIKSPLKLTYKAKIVQTTGIDWKQVKLTLATSMPAQNNIAPAIESWFLGYVDPLNKNKNNTLMGKVSGVQIRGTSNLSEVVVVGYTSASGESSGNNYVPPPKPVYVVDGNIMNEEEFAQIDPNSIKSINKLKPSEAGSIYGASAGGGATVVELKKSLDDYVSVNNNSLNVLFGIDIPYDVPTNGKEQAAILEVTDVNAIYKHYAVPKMDEDAFLLAQIPGWEKLNLLPGEANIIFEGTYIGKTFIDPNATADTMNISLGRDKRVVIKREKLVDFSSIKFLGSNKMQLFTYEITVKNNKAEQINLRLKDQYPLTTNKEIEVDLQENSNAEINKETGSLEWKIALEPGETKKVRFSYSIKYPKEKFININ